MTATTYPQAQHCTKMLALSMTARLLLIDWDDRMKNKGGILNSKIVQRLALPMFMAGIIAMIFSAVVITTNPAFAAGAAGYKISTVKLTYVTFGFMERQGECGSVSSQNLVPPNFKNLASNVFGPKNNDKWFKCEVTLTVLTK